MSMSQELNRIDAVRRERVETAQRLREVTVDPQLCIALVRRMRELLDEAEKISREDRLGETPAH